MRAACADPGLYATDVTETLVKQGVPFREAHRRTGELLKTLADRGLTLADLDHVGWKAFGVPDGAALLDPDRSIAERTAAGGPARASVEAQLTALDALFDA